MKKQGTIRRWNAERGFGFIRSPQSTADVFFHVRNFRGAAVRRPRSDAPSARRGAPQRPPCLGARWVVALVPPWLALIAYGVWFQHLHGWVAAAIGILNVLTLFAYAFDKEAAQRGNWRTAENTLHLFGLAGGWPAAWLAQQSLRHKSSKASFQLTYALTVLLNMATLGGWIFWLGPRIAP